MTEYSYYNCITGDTGRQKQDKAQVATSKLSVRMPVVLTMQK